MYDLDSRIYLYTHTLHSERPWNESLSARISEVQESFKNIPSMLYFSPSSVTFDGIGVYAAEALPKGINFYQSQYIHNINIQSNNVVIRKHIIVYFLGISVVCLLFLFGKYTFMYMWAVPVKIPRYFTALFGRSSVVIWYSWAIPNAGLIPFNKIRLY